MTRWLLALLLLAAVLPSPADAARWDPRFRWNTLRTEHFAIHFHQGLARHAGDMAHTAEEVHELLSPFIGWEPFGRTQIVLVDNTDSANGYAVTSPNNQIVIYVVQPTPDTSLDGYQDWMYAIFVHEYAHILQIDLAGGIPRTVRMALGRLVQPNAVMPRWLTEGFATWVETRFTTGGRGRSTYTDALVRLAALERQLLPIDTAEGFGQRWPQGQSRYLYGVDFHFERERAVGAEGWVRFHQKHGRWVFPWWMPAKEAMGTSFVKAWKGWKAEASERALTEAEAIEAAGLTPVRRLATRVGFANQPVYTPDGESVVYVHSSPKERASIRQVRRDGGTDERLRGGGAAGLVWAPDGQSLLGVAGGTTTLYENALDLYRYAPDGSKRTRLTRGARLRDPAPHPEGWVVAVQTWRGQNQLVRVDLPVDGVEEPESGGEPGTGGASAAAAAGMPLDRVQREAFDDPCLEADPHCLAKAEGWVSAFDRPDRAEEASEYFFGGGLGATVTPITAAEDGSQFAAPAWDPAGERLAVSVWKPGGFRDVHVLDRDGALLRSLSWDRALDSDPIWTPDGQHLVFASDRDGVWNLYAYRWADGSLWRVTRLLGGARHPAVAPDGRHVVFQSQTADGWALDEAPFDPALWEPVVLDARARPGPDWKASAQATAPVHPLEGVPGPDRPWGDGADDAVARARQRADFTTPGDGIARPAEPRAPGPRDEVSFDPELGTLKIYNPLPTLLPPRYLTVFGGLTDTGLIGGVGTGGIDALAHHAWSASLSYQTDSRYLGWSAGYTLNRFHPVFSVAFRTLSVDYGRMFLRHDPTPNGGTGFAGSYAGTQRYYERRDVLSAGVAVPVRRRHVLSARYKLEFRNPLRDLPDNVDTAGLPARGSFSGIVLGWAYGQFQRYTASVSPENSESISVSADIESSFLGAFRVAEDGSRSQLHRLILTAQARRYFALPWAKNHVLAVRIAAGATIGTDVPQPTFRIGGPFGDSAFVSLPDRYYMLRGYPTSSMRGDHVWVGSAEYRLPLLYVERGFWNVPLWLRSLSLSVWAEAGQVFDTEDYAAFGGSPEGFVQWWANTKPAVGAELVGDALLGWAGLWQVRLGYGYGFGTGATPGGAFYAQLGASF